jgi:catechol 2,3-dioxygenase-like lactoylglutathione lyase family enzyme
MIRTRGLTHTALPVSDLDRSISFYSALLGSRVLLHDDRVAEIGTPGAHDVITLERRPADQVQPLPTHIGFRLIEPVAKEELAAAVERAGGTVKEQGEFRPGMPYVFALDPDGHEIEIWFEPVNEAQPEA